MVLHREVAVGRGDEHLPGDPLQFLEELRLVFPAAHMFDHRVAGDDVERLVLERQRRARLDVHESPEPIGLRHALPRPDSRGRDLGRMRIVLFKEVRRVVDDVGNADVKDRRPLVRSAHRHEIIVDFATGVTQQTLGQASRLDDLKVLLIEGCGVGGRHRALP